MRNTEVLGEFVKNKVDVYSVGGGKPLWGIPFGLLGVAFSLLTIQLVYTVSSENVKNEVDVISYETVKNEVNKISSSVFEIVKDKVEFSFGFEEKEVNAVPYKTAEEVNRIPVSVSDEFESSTIISIVGSSKNATVIAEDIKINIAEQNNAKIAPNIPSKIPIARIATIHPMASNGETIPNATIHPHGKTLFEKQVSSSEKLDKLN